VNAARVLWRALWLGAHLLHGAIVMALRFPALDAAGRQARVQWWSAKLLRRAGIRLHSNGTPQPGAALLLANHISWLDIAVIHAVAPRARFVAKSDVLGWPLIGWLVKGAGTLFIERERKRDALRVLHQVAEALKAGDLVAVFPEGTTGTGRELLPFHANLLQSAIATGTPVQGVALRYSDAGQAISPAAEYLGETSLLQSIWRVLGAHGLRVRIDWLPALPSEHGERRALAAQVRAQIDGALRAMEPEGAGHAAPAPSHTAEAAPR
jgi:1-acyl-sn-glycerol-3-phosphate acyltransferase